MRKTVSRLGMVMFLLAMACFGSFCLGSLAGCSSDQVAAPGPTEDPVPPPLPPEGKTSAVEQEPIGEVDW